MSHSFLPVNPCCTDVVLNSPCGCTSTLPNTGCGQDQCGTNVILSSNVLYNGPILDCIIAEPCDTLNVILQKIDEIICNLLTQINILNIQVTNITTQIININTSIVNINNTLAVCCGATTTTTTTLPCSCTTYTLVGPRINPGSVIYVPCGSTQAVTAQADDILQCLCVDNTYAVIIIGNVSFINTFNCCTSPTTTTTSTTICPCTYHEYVSIFQFPGTLTYVECDTFEVLTVTGSLDVNVVCVNNNYPTIEVGKINVLNTGECCSVITTTTTTTTAPIQSFCNEVTVIGTVYLYWTTGGGEPQVLKIDDETVYICAQVGSIAVSGTGAVTILGSVITCESDGECAPTTTTTTTIPPSSTTTTTTTLSCTSYNLEATGTNPRETVWEAVECNTFITVGGTIIFPNILNTGCVINGSLLLGAEVVIVNSEPCPTTTTTTTIEPTTTTTTTIPLCSYVLLLDINGYVLKYDTLTNTSTILFDALYNGLDLAHSNNKLWINDASNIYEYDIILSPWSQTFNRTISTGSVQTGNALGKSPGSNNKLVVVDVSRSPGVLVELDITTSLATSVDIATLPAGAITPGDLLITDTVQPKILINLTNVTSGANGLYQYDYNTGAFEIYVPLGPALSAFGIYEENNLIYLVNGDGQTYSVLPTSPYTVTYVQAIPIISPVAVIVGASQLSECTKTILTLPPTSTTTSSSTSTTSTTTTIAPCVEWSWEAIGPNSSNLEYTDCEGLPVVIPIIDVTNNSGIICVYPSVTPNWNPIPTTGTHIIGTVGADCSTTTTTSSSSSTTTTTTTCPCKSFDIIIDEGDLIASTKGIVDVGFIDCFDQPQIYSYDTAGTYTNAFCAVLFPKEPLASYLIGTTPIITVDQPTIAGCCTGGCVQYTVVTNPGDTSWTALDCDGIEVSGSILYPNIETLDCLQQGTLDVTNGTVESEEPCPTTTTTTTIAPTTTTTTTIAPTTTTTTSYVGCRPEGLITVEYFNSYDDGSGVVDYTASLLDACTACNYINGLPLGPSETALFGQSATFAIGETVYAGTGTSCNLLANGFYITDHATCQITEIVGGSIINITYCSPTSTTTSSSSTTTTTTTFVE